MWQPIYLDKLLDWEIRIRLFLYALDLYSASSYLVTGRRGCGKTVVAETLLDVLTEDNPLCQPNFFDENISIFSTSALTEIIDLLVDSTPSNPVIVVTQVPTPVRKGFTKFPVELFDYIISAGDLTLVKLEL